MDDSSKGPVGTQAADSLDQSPEATSSESSRASGSNSGPKRSRSRGRGRRKRRNPDPQRVLIASLSREGQGVVDESLLVDGALPDEELTCVEWKRRRGIKTARCTEVHLASAQRVEAKCPHFGVCGGCSLQHLEPKAQVHHKHQQLMRDFEELGGVRPEQELDPVLGPLWNYRRRARLGVRKVDKKGRVLVGFRERETGYVTDSLRCEILAGEIGEHFHELSELIGSLSIAALVPQIEVSVGDGEGERGLVFRVLEEPTSEDIEKIRSFGKTLGWRIFLQPGGLETVTALDGGGDVLHYDLDEEHEHGRLRMAFRPTDFVQINRDINRKAIAHAIDLLQLETSHRVLDLFCGLGNFSLPIARRVAEVRAIEGDAGLVERARSNATSNRISNIRFDVADLYKLPKSSKGESSEDVHERYDWEREHFDRILLDPPRSGAEVVLPKVAATGAKRIVYVACGPQALARDAGVLVREYGYRFESAGVMDMFPHTAHVESIASFVRGE